MSIPDDGIFDDDLRMEMLSTWLHTLKVRSRSHRASSRLSNVLNVETSDDFSLFWIKNCFVLEIIFTFLLYKYKYKY